MAAQPRPSPAAPARAARLAPGGPPAITDEEFEAIRRWLRDAAGISLSAEKRALVMGRLAPRLRHHRMASYGDYFRLLLGPAQAGERQAALDLLTTNETHFFREPRHFEFLRETIVREHAPGRALRAWSAAGSSGEEAYSIAMTLADAMGEAAPWEVTASDVSGRVLQRARSGHYPLARAQGIPPAYLQRFCLKGVGAQEGTFLVGPAIRGRVQFMQVNLVEALPPLGTHDVVFLRNVMIYFDMPTKRAVVARVLPHLRSGGYLIVGHAESLHGVSGEVAAVSPSIYRKP